MDNTKMFTSFKRIPRAGQGKVRREEATTDLLAP